MFRLLKNNKAQSVAAEYVLVLFLVVGMMTAMTIFIKRAVQARIRDARHGMVDTIRERTAGGFTGNVYPSYEPYYSDTDSQSKRITFKQEDLNSSAGFASGVYKKTVNDVSTTQTISITAPPADAD